MEFGSQCPASTPKADAPPPRMTGRLATALYVAPVMSISTKGREARRLSAAHFVDAVLYELKASDPSRAGGERVAGEGARGAPQQRRGSETPVEHFGWSQLGVAVCS